MKIRVKHNELTLVLSPRFLKIPSVFCLAILLCQVNLTHSQSVSADVLAQQRIQFSTDLPQDILQSKAVVVISTEEGAASAKWKKMADELQAFFEEAGIDAVAYFHISELNSGIAVQRAVARSLTRRGVKIFVSAMEMPGERVLLSIGRFNQQWNFRTPDSPFWVQEEASFEPIFENLRTIFMTGRYKRENLLVISTPEYFPVGGAVVDTRSEQYFSWLRNQKLAVPLPKPSAESLNSLALINPKASSWDKKSLEEAMEEYPFDYGFVDVESMTEEEILRAGYTFLLYSLEGTEQFLKRQLQYKKPEEASDEFAVKYYVKHLANTNIYLGKGWDAGATHSEALTGFLNNVKTLVNPDKKSN